MLTIHHSSIDPSHPSIYDTTGSVLVVKWAGDDSERFCDVIERGALHGLLFFVGGRGK